MQDWIDQKIISIDPKKKNETALWIIACNTIHASKYSANRTT